MKYLRGIVEKTSAEAVNSKDPNEADILAESGMQFVKSLYQICKERAAESENEVVKEKLTSARNENQLLKERLKEARDTIEALKRENAEYRKSQQAILQSYNVISEKLGNEGNGGN